MDYRSASRKPIHGKQRSILSTRGAETQSSVREGPYFSIAIDTLHRQMRIPAPVSRLPVHWSLLGCCWCLMLSALETLWKARNLKTGTLATCFYGTIRNTSTMGHSPKLGDRRT